MLSVKYCCQRMFVSYCILFSRLLALEYERTRLWKKELWEESWRTEDTQKLGKTHDNRFSSNDFFLWMFQQISITFTFIFKIHVQRTIEQHNWHLVNFTGGRSVFSLYSFINGTILLYVNNTNQRDPIAIIIMNLLYWNMPMTFNALAYVIYFVLGRRIQQRCQIVSILNLAEMYFRANAQNLGLLLETKMILMSIFPKIT